MVKYVRKTNKKYSKRKPSAYKRTYKRSYPKKARVAPDPTVLRINPGPQKAVYVVKALREISPYAPGTVGTTGMFFGSTASLQTSTTTLLFDPAGVFGNNSINVAAGVSNSGPAAIQQWLQYAGLYDKYRVSKITLRFTAIDVDNLDVGSPILYIRKNDTYGTIAPTMTDISQQKNWIRKTFTAEQPDFTFSFTPRVQILEDNNSVIASNGRVPAYMSWTNTSTPISLYGVQLIVVLPASTTGYSVNCSTTYHLGFKESS